MEIAGICGVCNRGSRNLYTCWKCGTIACSECFNPANGLCARCSGGGNSWK